MQSERWEDIQFGTVSDVLTVSSSVQSECAPHVEVTSEKVGEFTEKVPCNDFKPNKLKKNEKTSKREEKLIKESDKQSLKNASLGCEVFQSSLMEIPWKTVLKSKQGKRKRKCHKYRLETLKKFETINLFRCLENIPEESVLIKESNTQSLKNTYYSISGKFDCYLAHRI